jgi:hypothetical protein
MMVRRPNRYAKTPRRFQDQAKSDVRRWGSRPLLVVIAISVARALSVAPTNDWLLTALSVRQPVGTFVSPLPRRPKACFP